MNRSSIFGWTAVLAAGMGAFFAVRALGPSPPDAHAEAAMGQTTGVSLSTAQLEAELVAALSSDDALTRRSRFLDLLEKADPLELKRLFFSTRTSRHEKDLIAQRWAETDPEGVFEYLQGLSLTAWERQRGEHTALTDTLFHAWALQDADAAMAAAASLERRPAFRGARWQVVAALFSLDPVKAFAAAATLPHRAPGGSLPEAVWKNDPGAFLRAADGVPLEKIFAFQLSGTVDKAFAEWARRDPTAAGAWLQDRPLAQQQTFWRRLTHEFAKVDPVAAQAWFLSTPPSSEREQAGVSLVAAWAKQDPHAALEWLQDHLESGRLKAFEAVARELANRGVDETRQLLDAMPPGAARDGVVGVAVQTWAVKDAKAAVAWTLSLPPDDPGRQRALRLVGSRWVVADLEGAAAYARENADREETRSLLGSVMRGYQDRNLGAGVAWAATLPASADRQEMFTGFYQGAWHRQNLPEVFTHVENLPADQRQAWIGGLTENLLRKASSDPGRDADLLRGLQQLPASLRPIARQTAERLAGEVAPERRQALLDTLR